VSTPGQEDGCPRVADAATYVLAALSAAERTDYVEHLAGCPFCQQEVIQLAGLPGLLARSGVDRPTEPAGPTGPPIEPRTPPTASADPVRAALAGVRRRRARGRVFVAAGLVAVGLLGFMAAGTVAGLRGDSGTGVVAAARLPVSMHPVGDARAVAALQLSSRPWGTEVVMRCRYLGSSEYAAPVYTLVVRGVDGKSEVLARWRAIPDQDIVLAGTTDLDRRRLAGLEVREADGEVVLSTVGG
jgi:hypothetical protein